MKKFFLPVIIVLLVSCAKGRIERDISLITGKDIVIPNKIPCYGGLKIREIDAMPTVLIWYDSTECAACKVHTLDDYTSFESTINDSIKKVNVVFIFSPKRIAMFDTRSKIAISLHNYPIFIDTANQFYKLNPYIPTNKLMHSFLLDATGRVVLVGNPIQNQAMSDLYKKTIEEMVN